MNAPSTTSASTPQAQARLAEIRAEISGRLWPVNAGMSSADFNELMDQMAQLQWNFERRAIQSMTGQVNTRAGHIDRRRNIGSGTRTKT